MTSGFNVKHHLFRAGIIDNNWVGAKPSYRHCRKCGADLLVAWRNSRYEAVAVDPIALTPYGELMALSTGRRTFTNWGQALDVRRADEIRTAPAGSDPLRPVHPEHACHADALDHTDSPAPQRRPQRKRKKS